MTTYILATPFSRNQNKDLRSFHVLNISYCTTRVESPTHCRPEATHPALPRISQDTQESPSARRLTTDPLTPQSTRALSSSRHHLEPLRHQLRNVLILVLQQPQRKRDIVPLALGITPRQPRRQLVRQLLRMLVLFPPLVSTYPTIITPLSTMSRGREEETKKGED